MKRRGFFGAFVALISAPFAFAAKAIKPKPKPYIPSTEPIVGTCSHCGEKIDNVRTVIRCYESWGEKGDKQGNKAGFRMPMATSQKVFAKRPELCSNIGQTTARHRPVSDA